MPYQNGDRLHRLWLRDSRGKEKGKGERNPPEKRYRVFYDVNRIGTSKVVTSIPILLGQCIQLHCLVVELTKN